MHPKRLFSLAAAGVVAAGAAVGLNSEAPRRADLWDRAAHHATEAYRAVVRNTPDVLIVKDAGKILGFAAGAVAGVLDGAHLLLNGALPDVPPATIRGGGHRISALPLTKAAPA